TFKSAASANSFVMHFPSRCLAHHNHAMDLPIACTLNEAQLRQRRQTIMDVFRNIQVSVTELPHGYAYTCAASSDALLQMAQLVDLEGTCCPFLTFTIIVEAGGKRIRLEVTGPQEVKTLITDYFNFSE